MLTSLKSVAPSGSVSLNPELSALAHPSPCLSPVYSELLNPEFENTSIVPGVSAVNVKYIPVVLPFHHLFPSLDVLLYTGNIKALAPKRLFDIFEHAHVLSVADTVIDAVKSGAINHFFLVGGCDGARPGRNYYTEFVQKTPKDSVVLTLACGKYRFNDLDLGTIGGLPRLMDMGQCNDAYSALKVALALAEAFKCGVNDLPLTLVLSWYEQKAVCILLTLLYLGIQNIYLGPTLPAFLSPNVLNYLVEHYHIRPISTPDEDLKKILG